MVVLPTVDVIIPTLNCSANLERCLASLERQSYPGAIEITVVDGGSTDGTLDLARKKGASVVSKPGQYGTGLSGARRLGETLTHSPFVWLIDSDNFLVEPTVAEDLVRPLLANASIKMTVPLTAVDRSANRFCQWLSLDERAHVLGQAGYPWLADTRYILVPSATYGVTNATMIRRDSLERAGGYDSDVRLLFRLRRQGEATALIAPQAQFLHNQAESPLGYLNKIRRRLATFSRLDQTGDSSYFFREGPASATGWLVARNEVVRLCKQPAEGVKNWLVTKDSAWLWGVAHPAMIGLACAWSPSRTVRAFRAAYSS